MAGEAMRVRERESSGIMAEFWQDLFICCLFSQLL